MPRLRFLRSPLQEESDVNIIGAYAAMPLRRLAAPSNLAKNRRIPHTQNHAIERNLSLDKIQKTEKNWNGTHPLKIITGTTPPELAKEIAV